MVFFVVSTLLAFPPITYMHLLTFDWIILILIAFLMLCLFSSILRPTVILQILELVKNKTLLYISGGRSSR
jgi:hypothetical protein